MASANGPVADENSPYCPPPSAYAVSECCERSSPAASSSSLTPRPTKPEAGVMATRPATAPEAAPSTVGLPRVAHSVNIQPSAAADAPVLVARNALAASPLASSALPALKPNQPNHSSPAPITVIGRLCGCIG